MNKAVCYEQFGLKVSLFDGRSHTASTSGAEVAGSREEPGGIELPEVVAHTAYYSMHHAAVAAVLLAYEVAVPKTHSGLIARLGQLDREKAWLAKGEVALLSRALDRRLIADYQAVDTLTIDHAKSAREDAIAFVSFCERMVALVKTSRGG
jgi:uncharacterized protein (UPF0332 family)